jgi:acetyltransferase-like isoleucine patch superfamily enzyme
MSDRFAHWKPPLIREGKPTKYGWLVRHAGRFVLGRLTDIGAFTYIQAKNGVTIEDEVQVGSHCAIYSVSTIDGREGPVVLRRNCRIGSHSVIMPGVEIGENAVVGAFSFVKEDVPANAVAWGVPAKVVGKRGAGPAAAAPGKGARRK